MLDSLRYQLRYPLPVWAAGLLTNWLPENGVVCRLRGALVSRSLGSCGAQFALGKDPTINTPDRLHVGARCYLARGAWIQALGGVTLEDEVVCGPYVVIASTNHGFVNGSTVGGGTHPAPVRIGRGTWLGAHAVVTPGVTIGRGNLIAAGAVVTSDTPDNVIVGGVPARVLAERKDNPSPIHSRRDLLRRAA